MFEDMLAKGLLWGLLGGVSFGLVFLYTFIKKEPFENKHLVIGIILMVILGIGFKYFVFSHRPNFSNQSKVHITNQINIKLIDDKLTINGQIITPENYQLINAIFNQKLEEQDSFLANYSHKQAFALPVWGTERSNHPLYNLIKVDLKKFQGTISIDDVNISKNTHIKDIYDSFGESSMNLSFKSIYTLERNKNSITFIVDNKSNIESIYIPIIEDKELKKYSQVK